MWSGAREGKLARLEMLASISTNVLKQRALLCTRSWKSSGSAMGFRHVEIGRATRSTGIVGKKTSRHARRRAPRRASRQLAPDALGAHVALLS